MSNAGAGVQEPGNWLLVDVSGLLGGPGLSRRFEASGRIEGLHAGLGVVEEDHPVEVGLELVSSARAIRASGRVSGRLTLGCSRCLVEFVQDLDLGVEEEFYFDSALAEAKEGYEVTGELVNLEPMLRDAIVLSIPIKPVHAADCQGLCPVCGADLNVTECGHGEPEGDLRWAPLRDLIAGDAGPKE
ncbi:MAG: DUF177 domain-containing protein [Actinomycetota bacterium]